MLLHNKMKMFQLRWCYLDIQLKVSSRSLFLNLNLKNLRGILLSFLFLIWKFVFTFFKWYFLLFFWTFSFLLIFSFHHTNFLLLQFFLEGIRILLVNLFWTSIENLKINRFFVHKILFWSFFNGIFFYPIIFIFFYKLF